MANSDQEKRIREGLDTVEHEFTKHFQSAGVDETEAKRRARKMVRGRGIGERVERDHKHDPAKASGTEERRKNLERQKANAEEARDRARHAAEKQATGRKIFT